jgi:catechol 2,3-dioxygenase-like lactoylglutathione lyase family enzyme
MHVARKHIRLGVSDPSRSAAFYQALLGAAPTGDARGVMVLESDSPPVVLVLEAKPRAQPEAKPRAQRPARKARASVRAARSPIERERSRATPEVSPAHAAEAFALVVTEPEHVGKAAVALWRTGARMRLGDEGLETRDPDGNAWRVRFVPGTKERAILALAGDGGVGS